jgi:hypothetical protein
MAMVDFQVTLVAGCFSAVNVLFVVFIILILIPILAYRAWTQYRERTAHGRTTGSMFKHLVSMQYDAVRFAGSYECTICLDDYSSNNECMITPLPCANTKLHIFHTKCIKMWLEKEHKCPLCKEHISVYNCKQLNENFNAKYPDPVA